MVVVVVVSLCVMAALRWPEFFSGPGPFIIYRGAAPGSSLEFNGNGSNAGRVHDFAVGNRVKVVGPACSRLC